MSPKYDWTQSNLNQEVTPVTPRDFLDRVIVNSDSLNKHAIYVSRKSKTTPYDLEMLNAVNKLLQEFITKLNELNK